MSDERNSAPAPHPSSLTTSPGGLAPEDRDRHGGLSPGTLVARYVVLGELGRGGMGVVYRAYDPDLDRQVALKFVQAPPLSSDTRPGEDRLRREAQTLARLSHPNIVPVHDVGKHEGAVFLTMELVEGQNLRHWLGERDRPRAKILEVFTAGARGLEAAHAAGIVHGDVKPSNLIVGDDGRVRVLDFGLARRSVSSQAAETTERAGTPAYMAPEQFAGQPADERSDQYSLCVALYEALEGERPGQRRPPDGTASAGTLHTFPPGTDTPRWLQKVVRRGLEPRPEARYPSMGALAEALSSDPTRWRRRAAIVLTSAAVVVGVLGGRAWAERRDMERCIDAGTDVLGWTPERREQVLSHIRTQSPAIGEELADTVATRLDDMSAGWRGVRRRVCQDPRLSSEQREAAIACLDGRAKVFAAALDSIEEAQGAGLHGAVRVARGLPQPTPCARPDDLEHIQRSRAAQDETVALEIELSRARAHDALGDQATAERLVRDAYDAALTMPVNTTTLDARREMIRLRIDRGETAAAVAELGEVVALANEHQEDRVAAEAASRLAFLEGFERGHYEAGMAWADVAESFVERATEPLPDSRGRILLARAAIHFLAGEVEEALQLDEAALPLLVEGLGPNDPEIAVLLNNIGATKLSLGDEPGAEAAYTESAAIIAATYGRSHPQNVMPLMNLGVLMLRLGRLEDAREQLEAAMRLHQRTASEANLGTADLLDNLGNLEFRSGNHERALEHHREALELRLSIGSSEARRLSTRQSVGHDLLALGKMAEALETYERAQAVQAATKKATEDVERSILAGLITAMVAVGRREDVTPLLEIDAAQLSLLPLRDYAELAKTAANTAEREHLAAWLSELDDLGIAPTTGE